MGFVLCFITFPKISLGERERDVVKRVFLSNLFWNLFGRKEIP